MSHHLARGERQCHTNVTPPGQRRAAVLHNCHTTASPRLQPPPAPPVARPLRPSRTPASAPHGY
eukprot:1190990-Prorocentrum_minimum.AAC.2